MQDKNLDKLKVKAEKAYKEIGDVFCPYFNEVISFNAKGLKHTKFKTERKSRNRDDQYMRLKNLHLAPTILKQSHTLQEMQERKIFIHSKTNKRNEKILKNVTYYAFIAIISDANFTKRLKVIIKEVEGGNKHFWSIIPFWKSNKELKLHSGDLQEG